MRINFKNYKDIKFYNDCSLCCMYCKNKCELVCNNFDFDCNNCEYSNVEYEDKLEE